MADLRSVLQAELGLRLDAPEDIPFRGRIAAGTLVTGRRLIAWLSNDGWRRYYPRLDLEIVPEGDTAHLLNRDAAAARWRERLKKR